MATLAPNTTTGWGASLPTLSDEQKNAVINEVSAHFQNMSLKELRGERDKLITKAMPLIQQVLSRTGMYATTEDVDEIARAIVARVGGLGFLEPLLRT